MKCTLWDLRQYAESDYLYNKIYEYSTAHTNSHTSVEVTVDRIFFFLILVLNAFDFWFLIKLYLKLWLWIARNLGKKSLDLLTLTKVPTKFPTEQHNGSTSDYFKWLRFFFLINTSQFCDIWKAPSTKDHAQSKYVLTAALRN